MQFQAGQGPAPWASAVQQNGAQAHKVRRVGLAPQHQHCMLHRPQLGGNADDQESVGGGHPAGVSLDPCLGLHRRHKLLHSHMVDNNVRCWIYEDLRATETMIM